VVPRNPIDKEDKTCVSNPLERVDQDFLLNLNCSAFKNLVESYDFI
jgi:hypothetical protein